MVARVNDKGLFTRYFSFTRVGFRNGDLELLLRVCERIDAYLCYRVDGVRLTGFIALRGVRTYVDDLCRLFPNFLLGPMAALTEDDGGYVKIGVRPFNDIRRQLF